MLSIEGIRQRARRAFFLGFLILPWLASGQVGPIVKPDYKAIEAAVSDSASANYYPSLMARLVAGDSTINLEESRLLYYGFQFQPNYSPYRTSPFEKEMSQLINQSDHTNEELHQLVVLADSVLAGYPFDLRTISIKMYCHDKLNMPEEIAKLRVRGKVMLDAIFSSGDGKSEKTRFFVLYTGNEYSIINILGFEFGGQQSLTKGMCDVLTLKPNPSGFKSLYFDVSALFNSMSKMLEK